MKIRCLVVRAVIGLLLVACLAPLATAQQKYAVLISAGRTTVDDNDYHSEFWYDLFIMYRMLVARGYTHDNIFVLYGDGNDFASAHPAYQTAVAFPGLAHVTDFPNSKADVANIFAWLAAGNPAHGVPQIQPGDHLFYWWMGHGDWPGDDASGNHLYSAQIQNTVEYVSDAEFAAMFAQLPACVVKTAFVMTCHSGALFDAIPGLHWAAHTSSRHDQSSFSSLFDVVHADFSYHAANALREQTPTGAPVASDTDGDGRLTIREANVYAHAHTTSSDSVVFDYRNIAPLIALEDPHPAGTVPVHAVYVRDCPSDSATTPSHCPAAETWFHGPDLWVRKTNDGITTSENAEFGQPNYVYARVHNIGCAPLNATATLSWSEQATWNVPAAWSSLGPAVPLNNLLPGESRVVTQSWTSVPVPGKYCLHTVVNAPGDAAAATGVAYEDNNQEQINIDVEDSFSTWKRDFSFWVRNGLKEAIKTDLVIVKEKGLRQSPQINLVLPPALKFDGVTGATARRANDGTLIAIPVAASRVVVRGIALAPSEQQEAMLTVALPARMKRGSTATVTATQLVREREVGGIVFQITAASKDQVVNVARQRLHNVLAAFAKAADSSAAREMAEIALQSRAIAPAASRPFASVLRALATRVPRLQKDFAAAFPQHAAMDLALAALRRATDEETFVAAQQAVTHASRPFFRMRASR
jgi:hypothetical protein